MGGRDNVLEGFPSITALNASSFPTLGTLEGTATKLGAFSENLYLSVPVLPRGPSAHAGLQAREQTRLGVGASERPHHERSHPLVLFLCPRPSRSDKQQPDPLQRSLVGVRQS